MQQIRGLADEVLAGLSERFEAPYSQMGQPSIPPEMLLQATRLLEADVARPFLSGLMALKPVTRLLSSDHFSVDGTLIEAWASMKSFWPKDGWGEPPGPGRNGERDFRNEKRSNETHASTTDLDARLYRKSAGQESRLCYLGHAVTENPTSSW